MYKIENNIKKFTVVSDIKEQPKTNLLSIEEALSTAGSVNKKSGDSLEDYLLNDVNRIIRSFPGWDFISGKKLSKHQKKQVFINDIFPDVDMVLVTPSSKIAMILSSKASLQDNAAYAGAFHVEKYHEIGIVFKIITRDTKENFKTGDTKYNTMYSKYPKSIYINNDYISDDPKKDILHDFTKYNFTEVTRPYSELWNDLHEFILKYTDKYDSMFFQYQDSCK